MPTTTKGRIKAKGKVIKDKAKRRQRYLYDPKRIHINVQEGGASEEVYVHTYDHGKEAEKAARQTEKDGYRILAEESIPRSKLERAGPHLYTAAKKLVAFVEHTRGDRTISYCSLERIVRDLEPALSLAEEDEHLQDILKACKIKRPKSGPSSKLAEECLTLMTELLTSLSSVASRSTSTPETRQLAHTLEREWRWKQIRENLMRILNSHMEPPKTPFCDKLAANGDRARILGEFLDWLRDKRWELAHFYRDEFVPLRKPPQTIIAAYLDLDEAKLEQERRALLEYQRWCNDNLEKCRDYPPARRKHGEGET